MGMRQEGGDTIGLLRRGFVVGSDSDVDSASELGHEHERLNASRGGCKDGETGRSAGRMEISFSTLDRSIISDTRSKTLEDTTGTLRRKD